MRTKKAIINAVSGYVYELTLIVSSFIVPRLILTGFGSDYNGLTSAINQFLQVFILLQAGISGVVRAALYKPLSENNTKTISIIIKTTRKYIQKIAMIYIAAILAIAAASLASVSFISLLCYYLGFGFSNPAGGITAWIFNAVLTALIAAAVVAIVELVFYRGDIKTLLVLLKKGVRSKV